MFKETVDVYFEFLFDLSFFYYRGLNVVPTGYIQKSTCTLPLAIAGRRLNIVFSLRPARTAQKRKNDKI